MEHDNVVISSRGIVAQKNSLIARALMSQKGRMSLAQAMAMPIRRNLDYQGIARRTLIIDPLPAPAIPVYNTEPEVTQCTHDSIVINSDGSIGQRSFLKTRRVKVPTFEIVSNPTVKIQDIKSRRFSLIDRYDYNSDEIVINSYGNIGRKGQIKSSSKILSKWIHKAAHEIMAQEDAAIFKALEAL